MKARDLKFPIFLGLSFFALSLLRRWLGIEIPQWFSILSAVIVGGLLIAFIIYGRSRQRLSDEYQARRDNAPKFEEDVHRSSFDVSKADK